MADNECREADCAHWLGRNLGCEYPEMCIRDSAWRLGGWVWSVAAMAMVAVLLLFALAFCKAAKAADPDGADDWWGE